MGYRIVTDGLDPLTLPTLEYLRNTYGIPPQDIRSVVLTSEVNAPQFVTVTVMVRRDQEIGPQPALTFPPHLSDDEMAEIKEAFEKKAGRPPVVLPETEIHTEDTMRKVRRGLRRAGLTPDQITDAVNDMQSEGILFREWAGLNHLGSDRWTGGDRKDAP
jgi:hypothetical protein